MSTPAKKTTPAKKATPAADRLLIHEIKLLGQEVARLRGDTAHLNEVIVPKEEHARRRRVYSRLAALSLLALVITFALFGYLLSKVNQQAANTKRAAYESCVKRNADDKISVAGGAAAVQVLTRLNEAEKQNKTPGIDTVRNQRIAAYEDYLKEIQRIIAMNPTTPPVNCNIFKR